MTLRLLLNRIFGLKTMYSLRYFRQRRRFPDLKAPKDYSETVIGMILSDDFLKYADYTDKIKVRDYIASKGWSYGKAQVISRTVEYVPFEVARNKVKGYYFDYSRIYWNKPENYTFKRERTWQFNNLKPQEYK